jgi:hypothetical protein
MDSRVDLDDVEKSKFLTLLGRGWGRQENTKWEERVEKHRVYRNVTAGLFLT